MQRGRRVYINGQRYTILRARPDQDSWLLQLAGVENRNLADELAGALIEAADADVRRDDSDSYFLHELVGLRVVTHDGRDAGTIVEVLQTGANDVYVAAGPLGEVLIPAIGDVVEEIDISAGVMRITPLAGMLDESQ